MQLVAASKMRRAQEAVLASRPFEEKLRAVLNELAPYADPEISPLLRTREVKRVGVVLITSERGLVGPMNTILLRQVLRFTAEQPAASYIAVGRKGTNSLRRLRAPIVAEFTVPDRPTSDDTNAIARAAVDEFTNGNVDEVYLAFTKFINTIRQEPTVRRLLPVVPEAKAEDGAAAPIQYLFEPDPETVLGAILPRLVEVAVYQAVLESKASQFSAQMVAMRNATDAAGDLIGELTLAANKARQTRITKEMLEIASGAEALSKG